MYVRVRFMDKTELCWTLLTAHVLRESDLSDWKTGDCKQLRCTQRTKSIGLSEVTLASALAATCGCLSLPLLLGRMKKSLGSRLLRISRQPTDTKLFRASHYAVG
jgi:hypothetical protein